MTGQKQADVLVIGGGPAGSTAANLLAQAGWQVTLVEKARHPRFHIGESLLPMNLAIFERLGVLDQVRAIGVHKPGAEFNSDDGKRVLFPFARALQPDWPHAWQVRRSELDLLLLNRSRELGVQVLEEHRVSAVTLDDEGVLAQISGAQGGPIRARFLVDASGRDTMLSKQFGDKHSNKAHASAALFGHFSNVPQREGESAGVISIYWFEHGWFWMIPLQGGVVSVGAVCDPGYLKQRQVPPAEFLQQTIALGPPELQQRMAAARAEGPVQATGNYSYTSTAMSGERFVKVGDAWAFVDPVFSSGVLLAMNSACGAAEYVDAQLKALPNAAAIRHRFEKRIRRGVREFSWMIARFNSPVMKHLFLAPQNPLRVQEAVISVLAGDVFRDNGVRWRYRLFRIIYYFNCLSRWSAIRAEWQRRRRRAQTRFAGGTLAEDEA